MAKSKKSFVCSECGEEHAQWSGQCGHCKEWNTVTEITLAPATTSAKKGKGVTGYAGDGGEAAKKMDDVDATAIQRFNTGINELDRVCGGGVTVGSVNLMSGDPGAGKTTLLSDVVGRLSFIMSCMYATGEESLSQFKVRFQDRLCIEYNNANLNMLASSDIGHIVNEAIKHKVKFLIVDSIQAMQLEGKTGSKGSPSQVRDCAQLLTAFAKQHGVTVFVVGQVNKQNDVAGPKVLEHIVDALFHIEVNSDLRTIRPSKNRFGDVDTIGLFKMNEKGMISVDNPSKIFLSSLMDPTPGSAISCIRDGSRNLLLEIQTLTTDPDGDFAQRVSVGINLNRLKLLMAILRKHGPAKMNNDTYVSLIGGLKLPETDTSADLAIAASLYSSIKDIVIPKEVCFIGELSLSGEIRPVNNGVSRVNEAAKHGFTTIFIPQANYSKKHMTHPGVNVRPLKMLSDAIHSLSDLAA